MGFVGTVIDLLLFQMMGNFGVIFAVATMGSFILSKIGRNDPADENAGYGQDEEAEQGDLYAEELTTDDLEQDESDDDNDTD